MTLDIFFKSWGSVTQVIITVFVTYPALIILLRTVGKRSLSKMNMFDFTITVALGAVFTSNEIKDDRIYLNVAVNDLSEVEVNQV